MRRSRRIVAILMLTSLATPFQLIKTFGGVSPASLIVRLLLRTYVRMVLDLSPPRRRNGTAQIVPS